MEFRIGHLAYQTADMNATLSFYRDVLGFKHIFSIQN